MQQYHDLLQQILDQGTDKPAAREGMPGSKSLFGPQIQFGLHEFPILTTKKIKFEHIVTELLWFLRGDTNISYLRKNNCNIWNEDSYNFYKKVVSKPHLSYEEFIREIDNASVFDESSIYNYGDCGYQYGKVWRDFGGVDQIEQLLHGLIHQPQSRRHLVTAVDPEHDDQLALYWCHSMFQFNARPMSINERVLNGREILSPTPWNVFNINEITHKDLDDLAIPKYYLDCKMYQRSADVFLGVPYNISSYALLTILIAEMVGMIPGIFIHTFGDVHIYEDHIDQVNEILERDSYKYKKPNLIFSDHLKELIDKFKKDEDFYEFINEVEVSDITLENYESYPPIKAKLSTGLK